MPEMIESPEAAADEGEGQKGEKSEESKAPDAAAAFCGWGRRGRNGVVHGAEICSAATRFWVAISFSYKFCKPSESVRVPERIGMKLVSPFQRGTM